MALMIAIAALGIAAPASAASDSSAGVARFDYERPAQNHCPGEPIVWVEGQAHSYNVATDRFYGRTRGGAYVCLNEAVKAGYVDKVSHRSNAR